MPSKTPSIVAQAQAARAKLAALQADAERLAADAAEAVANFKREPTAQAFTDSQVAAQRAANAHEAAERARVDAEGLFAAESRDLALTELATLSERYGAPAHAARIEPHIAAILAAETTVRRAVSAIVQATSEQRAAATRAAQLASKIGAITSLRAVDEGAALEQIRGEFVRKYSGTDAPVDSWLRYEPSLAALSKKASA